MHFVASSDAPAHSNDVVKEEIRRSAGTRYWRGHVAYLLVAFKTARVLTLLLLLDVPVTVILPWNGVRLRI